MKVYLVLKRRTKMVRKEAFKAIKNTNLDNREKLRKNYLLNKLEYFRLKNLKS